MSMTTVGSAVKITSFKVPSSYIIEDEENPGTLILDCEYKYQPGEDIVVSWELNGTRIYQWIAPNDKTPSAPSAPSVTVSILIRRRRRRGEK